MANIDLDDLTRQQPSVAVELVGRDVDGEAVLIENDFPTREEVTEEIESFVPDLSAYALKTELPKKTSELENDSGFITDAALTDYVKEEELSEALENYVLESEFVTSQSEQNEEINTNRARIENLEEGLDGYALITEGVLLLPSKYFTPVDNGSGGLQLNGITFTELQDYYSRYDAGVKSIQTNTSGFINLYVESFSVNESSATFIYRWAIGDYTTNTLYVYQALISGTSANVITPVTILDTLDLSGVVTESNIDEVLLSHFQNATFHNVSIQADGNVSTTSTGNYSVQSSTQISLSAPTVLINNSPAATHSDLELKQDKLTAGENITISPTNVISSQIPIAASDELLTYDTAGLKANLSVEVNSNVVSIIGKDNIVIGTINLAVGQINNAYYDSATNEIVIVVNTAGGGTSDIRIPADDLIDIYTASGYIEIDSENNITLNYPELTDHIINDGLFVRPSELSSYVTTDTAQTITGSKTFNAVTYNKSNVFTGNKTSSTDGVTGSIIGNDGTLRMCATAPVIYFYAQNSTIQTAYIGASGGGLTIYSSSGFVLPDSTLTTSLGSESRLFTNIFSRDATFTNRPKIGGVDAALISDIPIIPRRVKVNHSTAVTLTNNTPVTLSTTATAPDELRSFQNAKISCKLTFQPDAASIGIGGLVNLLISDINMNVRCEFLVNNVSVDSFYFTIARTGRLQTCEFTTVQNISGSQVISIRLTPTISSGTLSIPASTTANYIAIL